jgi:hypothetical protein
MRPAAVEAAGRVFAKRRNTMPRVVSSRLLHPADESADAIVAATGRKFLAFLVSPFALVLAMRPQREGDAARIAAESHCDRWKANAEQSGKPSQTEA